MDELRIEIWDYLYRADGARAIDDITQAVGRDDGAIRSAVDHQWFEVVGDMVRIANQPVSHERIS